MTQEEFEHHLGLSKGVMSRYESGGTDPSPSQLVEMSKKLQVTVDWLLGLTHDPEGFATSQPLTPEEISLVIKYRSGDLDELAYDLLGKALANRGATSDAPDHKNPVTDVA